MGDMVLPGRSANQGGPGAASRQEHQDYAGGGDSPLMQHLLIQQAKLTDELRSLHREIARSVGTLDLIVYEHDTQQLPTGQDFFTLNLTPQTAQTELISGLFVAITVPDLVAAPTITITNAWAKIGGTYVNLNAVINSAAGTGGMLPGKYQFVLNSESSRQVNVVASADWPSGAYLSFALFGEALPTQDGGTLH